MRRLAQSSPVVSVDAGHLLDTVGPWAGAVPPLQADATGGGVLAVVVTFLLAWLFYAVTLHLAATFFIGEVPSQRAAAVGLVPAVVSLLLGRYGVEGIAFVSPGIAFLLAFAVTLVADAIAISSVYRISWRPTTALTALHLAFSVALIIPLNNIFGFV